MRFEYAKLLLHGYHKFFCFFFFYANILLIFQNFPISWKKKIDLDFFSFSPSKVNRKLFRSLPCTQNLNSSRWKVVHGYPCPGEIYTYKWMNNRMERVANPGARQKNSYVFRTNGIACPKWRPSLLSTVCTVSEVKRCLKCSENIFVT